MFCSLKFKVQSRRIGSTIPPLKGARGMWICSKFKVQGRRIGSTIPPLKGVRGMWICSKFKLCPPKPSSNTEAFCEGVGEGGVQSFAGADLAKRNPCHVL